VRWNIQRLRGDVESYKIGFKALAFDLPKESALILCREYDGLESEDMKLIVATILMRRFGYPHVLDGWETETGSDWEQFVMEELERNEKHQQE